MILSVLIPELIELREASQSVAMGLGQLAGGSGLSCWEELRLDWQQAKTEWEEEGAGP